MPKITDLISFEGTLSNSDVFPVVNSSITKKIPMSAMRANVLIPGSVSSAMLQVDSVTSTKISNSSVTETKIADGAVTNAKLSNGSVNAVKIADLSITGGKIVNSSITDTQLAANAVTTTKISDLNVTTAKIADQAVTTQKMAALQAGRIILGNASNSPTATLISGDASLSSSGVLTVNNISDGAVTTAKISDLAVTAAKIANANITESKIANSNVTDDKLSSTGVSSGTYGSVSSGTVVIPQFTVNTKGRITSAGSTSFPGNRVVQRVIYNLYHDSNSFLSITQNLPGTSSPTNQATWGGVLHRNCILTTSEVDIFGNRLLPFTPIVAGSKVHFASNFHVSSFANRNILMSVRFKINGSEVKKNPISAADTWFDRLLYFDHWYPNSSNTPLTFTLEARADTTYNYTGRFHYTLRWNGDWSYQYGGGHYVAPEVIITEWV